MDFDKIDMRKKVRALTEVGSSADIHGNPDIAERETRKFCRANSIRLKIESIEGGIRVTRLPGMNKGEHAYPQIAALEEGQSVLLNVPPISHQRVRVTASQTAIKTGATYRCMREGDAIRVVRTDGAVDAANLPQRTSKYNLDRLASERKIVFEIERQDRVKLRSACSSKSAQTGWAIRCRLQDDGTMLVYRTDNPAIHPDAQPPYSE